MSACLSFSNAVSASWVHRKVVPLQVSLDNGSAIVAVFHKPSIIGRKSKECTYISQTFRSWPVCYSFDFFRAVGPPLVQKPHDPRMKCVLKSVHLEGLTFNPACPRTEMTVFSLSNSSRCVLAYTITSSK